MAAAHLEGPLLIAQRQRRAELDLDRLRRPRADRQLIDGADVVRDGVVHLIAADPHRARDHDPPERDHRHLAGAAAHVDDQPADRLLDRQSGPDGRRDRLLDQVHAPRAGGQRGLLDGPLLDLGDARGRAHDQPGVRGAPIEHLADEVAQHLLGDLEVGDHAVAQRAGGRDRRRGAPDHPLRLGAHRVHLAGRQVRGDHRRLGDDDPPPADVDERVGGAQVDRHVVHAEAGDEGAAGVVATGTVSAKADAERVADPRPRRGMERQSFRCRPVPAGETDPMGGAVPGAGWSPCSWCWAARRRWWAASRCGSTARR